MATVPTAPTCASPCRSTPTGGRRRKLLSALWQLRDNGANDRVGVFIEQVDEDFLDRNGYDRDGDLYKFVQRSNLDPVFNDIITGIEKKTNDKSDLTTARGISSPGSTCPTSDQRRACVIDHLDLPQILNYLAVRSIIQDADDLRKNFYCPRDIHGDGRWRIFPWDKDFTFGVRRRRRHRAASPVLRRRGT